MKVSEASLLDFHRKCSKIWKSPFMTIKLVRFNGNKNLVYLTKTFMF